MDDKLITVLQEYGLSEKEAKIYLVTLELGSAPASTIARRAGIKRVTAYALLQDLKRQEIAQSVEKGGVTNFQVIDPNKLLKRLETKYQKLQEQIPALVALADQYSNKPRIQYFEGVAGIKQMYEDLLVNNETICSFLWTQELPVEVSDFLYNNFLPRRIKQKIKAKVILSSHQENKKYAGLDKKALKESFIIDNKLFEIANEIDLYGPGKVMFAMFTADEMSGVIIHSPKLYKTLKSIFDLIWTTQTKK